jgi:hypothetical protein
MLTINPRKFLSLATPHCGGLGSTSTHYLHPLDQAEGIVSLPDAALFHDSTVRTLEITLLQVITYPLSEKVLTYRIPASDPGIASPRFCY